MKSPATYIRLVRAEGPTEECTTEDFRGDNVWRRADSQLLNWSESAPDKGQGYDKVDFYIVFDDGETYAGTYLLNNWRQGTPSLGQHLRQHLAGMTRLKDKAPIYAQGLENLTAFHDTHEIGA